MSGLILTVSVVSTVLFALVVLTKLGLPVIFSVLLALAIGYVWWRYERDDNENQGVADGICALLDVKDIIKNVNKLF